MRDERVLVVWSYSLDNIISTCRDFDEKLIQLAWKHRSAFTSLASSAVASANASHTNLNDWSRQPAINEKEVAALAKEKELQPKRKRSCRLGYFVSDKNDVEKTAHGPSHRPVRLFAPFYSGLAAALSTFFIASGVSVMIQETVLDDTYTRFVLLATTPLLFCVSLCPYDVQFFSLQIVTNVSYVLGPVAQFHENSKYYSAIPPAPNKDVDANLPHITIELPVYKESLNEVIAPSVYSLKKAMQTYARQGGTSAIFVHDDGLQLLPESDRVARIAFYADNNIGWVARPAHDNAPDGFKRAGRFKKASNMNYGLALSLKLEKHLLALEAEAASRGGEDALTEDGECLEDKAMNKAIEETFEESGHRWRPWARNGRSLRVGEIILIVDSDTVVPEDCLRDAARELYESPEVAIIQHESDVMQVAHHYFENGIAHFTRRINKCISMGCANGEVAPFVGHNAFLRWSALQDAAFVDAADGVRKIWSEANVSEDFDMALRLQLKGYIIRWSTYSEGGFKEGVSLTCDDELNRWQKYAYGCNELIFNPLIHWWRLGPINKQLRIFIWSAAPVHYKFSMLSYMFSYYGIAAAALLATMNYFLLGWGVTAKGILCNNLSILCCATLRGAEKHTNIATGTNHEMANSACLRRGSGLHPFLCHDAGTCASLSTFCMGWPRINGARTWRLFSVSRIHLPVKTHLLRRGRRETVQRHVRMEGQYDKSSESDVSVSICSSFRGGKCAFCPPIGARAVRPLFFRASSASSSRTHTRSRLASWMPSPKHPASSRHDTLMTTRDGNELSNNPQNGRPETQEDVWSLVPMARDPPKTSIREKHEDPDAGTISDGQSDPVQLMAIDLPVTAARPSLKLSRSELKVSVLSHRLHRV
ncbi:predicted protein [Postia placenta Mad-698-R]|nr:predicted protein [Postia placenta Mad-698-R]